MSVQNFELSEFKIVIDCFLFKVFRNGVNDRAFPVVKTSGAQRIFFTGSNENELVRTFRDNNRIQKGSFRVLLC